MAAWWWVHVSWYCYISRRRDWRFGIPEQERLVTCYNDWCLVFCLGNFFSRFVFAWYSLLLFVVDWWNDVYGFDMSSIGSTWKDDAVVDTCKKDQVVTDTQQIRKIYLQIFTKEEIPFEEQFSLNMKRDDYVNVRLFVYIWMTRILTISRPMLLLK